LFGRGFPSTASATPSPVGILARLVSLLRRRGGLYRGFVSFLGVFRSVRFGFPGFVMAGVFLIIVAITVLLTMLLTIVAAARSQARLILPILSLLRLMTALLLGALVEGGGEILEGSDEMDAQIALGFVGLLDGLGNSLDRAGEVVERCLNALEGGGDAFEDFGVGIGFRGAHERRFVWSEWAQEEGWLASDL